MKQMQNLRKEKTSNKNLFGVGSILWNCVYEMFDLPRLSGVDERGEELPTRSPDRKQTDGISTLEAAERNVGEKHFRK